MKTRSLLSLSTFALLVIASPLIAAADPDKDALPVIPDSTEKQIVGHLQIANLQKLQGWPGIVFYCPGDENSIPAAKQICADTQAKLEALSTHNKVKFNKARNANDVALLPHLTGYLKLLVELTPTESGSQPAAIAARVAVLAHYTSAINRYADLNQDEGQDKHPLNVPQHVDAILWESSLVKAGASLDALAKPVADGLIQALERFFADYARANK